MCTLVLTLNQGLMDQIKHMAFSSFSTVTVPSVFPLWRSSLRCVIGWVGASPCFFWPVWMTIYLSPSYSPMCMSIRWRTLQIESSKRMALSSAPEGRMGTWASNGRVPGLFAPHSSTTSCRKERRASRGPPVSPHLNDHRSLLLNATEVWNTERAKTCSCSSASHQHLGFRAPPGGSDALWIRPLYVKGGH